jgi:hypothetical protein
MTYDSCYLLAGNCIDPVSGTNSIAFVKIRSNGDTVFSRSIAMSQFPTVQSVQLTNDNGFILCGMFDNLSLINSKIFILKTDANGAVLWNRIFSTGTGYDQGYSIRQTSDGGYILSGSTYNMNTYQQSATLIRLNQNGVIIWSKKALSPTTTTTIGWDAYEIYNGFLWMTYDDNSRNLKMIRTDFSGSPVSAKSCNFMSGQQYFQYPVPRLKKSRDGGYYAISSSWGYGDQLIKMDSTGAFQWNSSMQLITSDVEESPDNGYFVLGNGPIMGVILAPTNNPQIGVIKTDSLGNSSSCTWPQWLAADTADLTMTNLLFNTTSDVISVNANHPVISNVNLSIFEGCVAITGGFGENQTSENSIVTSPNPSDGHIRITTKSDVNTQVQLIEIFNGMGKIVYKAANPDIKSLQIDLSSNPDGIYLVRLNSGTKTFQGKFLICK